MLNGILNVYKEAGYTSFDVVAKLRRIVGQKKIGHTGTLDPDAEGVLPVCLGKATKVVELLTDADKSYRCVLLLGVTTDTQDMSGRVLSCQEVTVREEEVRETILSFVGAQEQIPPMYSALKVNGKKLYELAREGKEIERKPRRIQIHQIQIEEVDFPRITMEVICSKGTYIRTLCHDIGNRLGCGGAMEKLLRTRVGSFELKDSLKLAEIQEKVQVGEVATLLMAVDTLFSYPKVRILPEYQRYLENGNRIPTTGLVDWKEGWKEGNLLLYDGQGRFAGIYQWEEQGEVKLVKNFLDQ